MLTRKQIIAREGKLTASRVACLMSGDAEKIYNLWLEMTGDNSFTVEDLEGVWAVKLGEATEQLNLDWFAKKHGPVTGRGKVVVNPDTPWMAATLDGWSETYACPIEAKHNNGFGPVEDLIQRYMPQMHWQMLVLDADQCALSVIRGAKEPEVHFIPRDAEYAAELLRRAENFMLCVRTLTSPVALPAVEAPKAPATKTMDMTGNGVWAGAATIFIENRQARALYNAAERALKKLVPDDVKIATGHGIKVKRNKAGSLSITLAGADDGKDDED